MLSRGIFINKCGLFVVAIIVILLSGCVAALPNPAVVPTAEAPLALFPFDMGTTWIYSFETYDMSSTGDIVNATYQLTETVVETKDKPPYVVALVKSNYELITADEGWNALWAMGRPTETWFATDGQRVFKSAQPIDESTDMERLFLEYQLPLVKGGAWCLDQTYDCKPTGLGMRNVESKSSFEIPTASFDDCYEILDRYNGGSIFQTFCHGAGVVSKKFDHVGSQFGYKQTLIDFFMGAPK